MVICDDDRIFPNKIDPSNWFIPNLLDGLAYGAMLTTPRVIALGAILTPCRRHRSCATVFAFLPNKFDPFDWFIPYLLDALMRNEFDYAQSRCTRGSFIFLAISTAISR
jgi:hypothetical protein